MNVFSMVKITHSAFTKMLSVLQLMRIIIESFLVGFFSFTKHARTLLFSVTKKKLVMSRLVCENLSQRLQSSLPTLMLCDFIAVRNLGQ